MQASRYLTDLARLLYPHQCMGCGTEVYMLQHWLCHSCLAELPVTGFEKSEANYTAALFAGRLPIQKGASWLFFSKHALTQKLIHQLKYRSHKALGEYLGKLMGARLVEAGWMKDIDVLVPLPLNKKKLAKRGFNQSMVLCKGLAEATGRPIEEVAVVRTRYTETQTKKSRIQRWANVAEVFDLRDTGHLHHRHALLVDDVITTGATMEACGQVLLKIPGLRLSVLSLAVAANM